MQIQNRQQLRAFEDLAAEYGPRLNALILRNGRDLDVLIEDIRELYLDTLPEVPDDGSTPEWMNATTSPITENNFWNSQAKTLTHHTGATLRAHDSLNMHLLLGNAYQYIGFPCTMDDRSASVSHTLQLLRGPDQGVIEDAKAKMGLGRW